MSEDRGKEVLRRLREGRIPSGAFSLLSEEDR
jgi:hypothetical protein